MGVARISGHGVATTSTASAATGEPEMTQPSPATASVIGRKTTAARSASRAVRGRSASACSTRCTMRAYVDAAAGAQRDDLDRLADDARAAADLVAGVATRRQGLAGQRSLVEHCAAAQERAVDRDDLAREHAAGDRRRPPRPPARRRAGPPRGGARRPGARGERGQLAPGAPERALVEQLAAREHQRDDQPRLELAEEQRAAIASSAITSAPSCPRSMRRATVEGERHDRRRRARPSRARAPRRPRRRTAARGPPPGRARRPRGRERCARATCARIARRAASALAARRMRRNPQPSWAAAPMEAAAARFLRWRKTQGGIP